MLNDFITGLATGACTLASTVNDEKRKEEIHKLKVQQERIKLQHEQQKLENLYLEEDLHKLRIIEQKLKNFEAMESLVREYGNSYVENINNDYIRNRTNEIYRNNQIKTQELIIKNQYKQRNNL